MTVKELLEKEGVKVHTRHISRIGEMIAVRAHKDGIKIERIVEPIIVRVNNYPDEFAPQMKKILKQYQFIMKQNKKKLLAGEEAKRLKNEK